jgi:hypothetical protein
MTQIPCKYGTIYPYGGELLAVECDYHNGIAARLAALGLRHSQCGDYEHTFIFHVNDWAKVAAVVKPKKRHKGGRGASPEQMTKIRAKRTLDREQL